MIKTVRFLKSLAVSILLICVLSGAAIQSGMDNSASSSNSSNGSSSLSIPCFDAAAFDVGNACFTVTNNGAIGSLIDISSVECLPWVLHYPKNSNVEYLFVSALWIGGIVGGDSLVSTGHDGWTLEREMSPDTCPDGEIQSILPGVVSDQDMIAKFTDTIIKIRHVPMGIEITQKSYVWSGNTGGEFYLFDCIAKNIGTNNITSGWVGILCDADVGAFSPLSYLDDLSGYLPNEKIAYIIDNDGDPLLGAWSSVSSARGAIGYKFLGSEPPLDSVRFNWWAPNNTSANDWGPRLAGTPQDPFRDFGTGGLGTPFGDSNRYYMLLHDETDYDQIWANTDLTGSGWLPPHASLGSSFASGADARFLYSFGPFNLLPGDSIRFFYAMAIGDSVHIDPDNFTNNMPDNPQTYYNNLNFNNLVNLINAAELKYMAITGGTGIEEITDVLPTDFELSQNYPNPFNPTTEIEFSVPRGGHVEMAVYNILGQRVTTLLDEDVGVGTYKVTWDGKSSTGQDVSSGIYLLRMQSSEFVETRKMLLLR